MTPPSTAQTEKKGDADMTQTQTPTIEEAETLTREHFAAMVQNDLSTTEDVAALAKVTPATVRWWAHVGRGPRGFKLAGSRRTYYAREDVVAWLVENHAHGTDAATA